MEGRGRRRPRPEDVIAKIKDDGDFDNLRLKIIRRVKENEELRSSIVTEVKQSAILNQDGSENLKPRQLSDAIYQELGKKIMGQISDELWKVIRSNEETKKEIRETVESVYDRIINPKVKEEDLHSSPVKDNSITGMENGASSGTAFAVQSNVCDESEPKAPPGFAPSEYKANECKGEHRERSHEQQPCLPSKEVHCTSNTPQPDDDVPPGFAPTGDGGDGGDADVPPGFGTGASVGIIPPGFGTNGLVSGANTPGFDTGGSGTGGTVLPGFGTGIAGGGDDDDPDLPPGFG